MADDTRLSQDEFEALVNDIKGDCDKCKLDCRDRLQWMDSIVEALRQERAEIKTIVEVLTVCTLELSQIAKRYDANRIYQQLNELLASSLKDDKGPHDSEDKDLEKKLSDWN